MIKSMPVLHSLKVFSHEAVASRVEELKDTSWQKFSESCLPGRG